MWACPVQQLPLPLHLSIAFISFACMVCGVCMCAYAHTWRPKVGVKILPDCSPPSLLRRVFCSLELSVSSSLASLLWEAPVPPAKHWDYTQADTTPWLSTWIPGDPNPSPRASMAKCLPADHLPSS